MKRKIGVALLALGFLTIGCTSPQVVEEESPREGIPAEVAEEKEEAEEMQHDHDLEVGVLGTLASAEMFTGEGDSIGIITFTQLEEGVLVEGSISGLAAGTRGFHVHENGICDPPDFMGAGGHFNPTGAPHGGPHDHPDERHAGDFGNIEVDEDESATFSFIDPVITLGAGINDVIGHALIIHEEEDDLESQPVGNAGARAACGLIEVRSELRGQESHEH